MKTFSLKRFALFFSLFIFVVLTAFFIRTYHCNLELERISSEIYGRNPDRVFQKSFFSLLSPLPRGDFVPFTVESAIMYSYAADVASGRGIPYYDRTLAGMEYIPVRRQMSIGLEYFLGWGYRIKKFLFGPRRIKPSPFEENPDFSRWIRFQIRLWVSLASGFIFLWLIVMRCPWYFALFGGLLHAFSPAAVARYTGLDLVRGEFCLPLIVLVFVTANWAFRRSSALKLALLAVLVFSALATWDMCQICFSIWGLIELIRLLSDGSASGKRGRVWIVIYVSAVLAAVLVPYHREHAFLLSPMLFIIFPLIVLVYCFGRRSFSGRLTVLIIGFVSLFFMWRALGSFCGYVSNYSHFAELMKAKLAFGNVKPPNPELLSFDARILWTPAMHSATWAMTKNFFPLALYVFFAVFLCGLLFSRTRLSIKRGLSRSLTPFIMTLVYLVGYFYIVRYHVFCILFLSVAFAMLFHDIFRVFRRWAGKIFVLIIAFIVLAGELDICTQLVKTYDSEYFPETAALISWLRTSDLDGRPIMADMRFSPVLKAYCGAGIVLQPKFELARTRALVERFINLMFHGTEKELNEFCSANKAAFLLYDRGYNYSSSYLHPYSNRYIAAAVKTDKKSPAFMFYNKPDKCRYFYRIEPPPNMVFLDRKYILFKVISPRDIDKAEKARELAYFYYRRGTPRLAAGLARAAYFTDPVSEKNKGVYFHVFGKLPPKLTVDRCLNSMRTGSGGD